MSVMTHDYFESPPGDRLNNRDVLTKVARKSYLPTNALFLGIIK